MKKILSLGIVAFFSLSLFASDIFDFAPLKGNVKSYTQTDFSISTKFGAYYRTPTIKITHNFDSFGREIESLELSARDTILNKITTEYDSTGMLLGQSCTNQEGELLWKNAITYKDGLKTESSEYDAEDNLKAKIMYTYDGKNLVDETGYNGEGALVWKIIYKYNAAGRLDTESSYNSDGSLDNRLIYKYTEDGKIDSITTIDSVTSETTQKVFRYGTNNLLNEITVYDNNKQISSRITLKYDGNGNVIKVSDYKIMNKFDTTVNELVSMSEFSYSY